MSFRSRGITHWSDCLFILGGILLMIIAFKIIIDEEKRASIFIYKTRELDLLLDDLIRVLQYSFPKVRITSKEDHYHVAGISNAGTFATIKSFIEELYIRFLDDVDPEELDFDPKYFFL